MFYQFIDPKTDEPVNIEEVENEFVARLRSPSRLLDFPLLTMIGDYCLLHGEFDLQRFIRVAGMIDLGDSHVFLDFLHGKYHYKSFR